MGKRKVLITGAAGYVASLIREHFANKYDLVMADITNKTIDGTKLDEVHIVDFINTDRSGYSNLFDGVDSVIHLSYKRSSSGGIWGNEIPQIDRFSIENENIIMANNVYRAAYESGVRRMVIASSNHAADWYEHELVHQQLKDIVHENEYPVSDNFYGWSKASYELLSWPYACGAFGRKMGFVQVRIGYPREVDAETIISQFGEQKPAGGRLANFKRHLGAHFSGRDLRQLFTKAIETEDINNRYGIPFNVMYSKYYPVIRIIFYDYHPIFAMQK